MKTIKINTNVSVILPDGYRRIKLPFYTKWTNALESRSYTRGTDSLIARGCGGKARYCCLGVLSKIQGRLTKDGMDGECSLGLSESNPCFPVLGTVGSFPTMVRVVIENPYSTHDSLASLNDSDLVGFKTISEVIKAIWKA